MNSSRDLFTQLIAAAQALASTAMTATKTDCPVVDLRDFPAGSVVGFLVHVTAAGTADASNFFEFLLHEADEKTSSTALTSGTLVADADLLGFTRDGVLISGEGPNPVVNSTTDAGKVFWFSYRGYKNCVQLVPTETGTAAITASAIPIVFTGGTVNSKAALNT